MKIGLCPPQGMSVDFLFWMSGRTASAITSILRNWITNWIVAGGKSSFTTFYRSTLSKFDIWQIPLTKALLDQKLRSLDPIDDFVFNRLWTGALLHDDQTWRNSVPKNALYAEYVNTATRMGIGRRRSDADFGKRLLKLIPGITDLRPRLEIKPGVVDRVRCYHMPSREECRLAFDKCVGQAIDWLVRGESERAPDADEALPA